MTTATLTPNQTDINAQRDEYRKLATKVSVKMGENYQETVARHRSVGLTTPQEFLGYASQELQELSRPASYHVIAANRAGEWDKYTRIEYTVADFVPSVSVEHTDIKAQSLSYYCGKGQVEVTGNMTRYGVEYLKVSISTLSYGVKGFKKRSEAMDYAKANLKTINAAMVRYQAIDLAMKGLK